MLRILKLRTEIKADLSEFNKAILAMSEGGWEPSISKSLNLFLEMAGVKGDYSQKLDLLGAGFARDSNDSGEIFFRENEIFYVRTDLGFYGGLWSYPKVEHIKDIEIGIITNKSEDANQRLEKFSESFKDAFLGNVDGRKGRHLTFKWVNPGKNGAADAEIGDADIKELFAKPEFSELEIIASKCLAKQKNREFIIEISQAGFVREKDAYTRRKVKAEDFKEVLNEMRECGLLRSEYTVECKKTGSPLTRIESSDVIENSAVGTLKCPHCNNPFSQENLTEGYSMTAVAKKLVPKSHWMTIIVTSVLRDLGVSMDIVKWNVVDGSEEIDIIVDFPEGRWIFELKDREFGGGDAHPLNYRQVRYKAERAIIVTTDKVSKDAKRILGELIEQSSDFREDPFIYVEGLATLSERLEKELSMVAINDASSTIRKFMPFQVIDIVALLSRKFAS